MLSVNCTPYRIWNHKGARPLGMPGGGYLIDMIIVGGTLPGILDCVK